MMNSFSLNHILMTAVSGMVQMGGGLTVNVSGDSSLLDSSLASLLLERGLHRDFRSPSGSLLQSRFNTYHEFSFHDLYTYVHLLGKRNRKSSSLRKKDYEAKVHSAIRKRDAIWMRLFMGILHEDESRGVSEDECEREMLRRYYRSCGYDYPLSFSIFSIVQSLCRFRKHKGFYVLSDELFCGLRYNTTLVTFMRYLNRY